MKKNFTFLAIVFISFCFSSSLKAQIFLKFANVTGSSTTTLATGLIDVNSFGTSAACSACAVTPVATGGASKVAAGKIVFNVGNSADVIHLKTLLYQGKVTPSACFVFTKPIAAKLTAYYYVILSNVTVIEVDEANAGGTANSTMQVSLGYSAITYTYKPQNTNGQIATTPVSTGWDFSKNIATTLPIPVGL